MRSGCVLIYLELQDTVPAALRECGAPEPVEFDAYEDVLDWGGRYL